MIDRSVEGRVLRGPGNPDIRVLLVVTSLCDCEVYVGHRIDLFEATVAWASCDAHGGDDGPQARFRRSLVEDPQARPVEDVIEEMLREANGWTPLPA